MTTPDGSVRTSSVDGDAPCRLFNKPLTDGIVARLREGGYCTLLGPKYSHKSHVLRDVQAALEAGGECWTCVLVDLKQASADSEAALLESVGARVSEVLGLFAEAPPTSPEALRRHLDTCLAHAPGDVALLVDHLEHVPLDAVRALLVVLRALYSEREAHAPKRLTVVIASALSLATLSIGATSPFNIAHPFFVADLLPDESLRLIDCVLSKGGVSVGEPARQVLRDLTRGDRHLIPLLCQHCVEMVETRPDKCVQVSDVRQTEKWFHHSCAATYAPLQDTIRALEDQPIQMLNLLRVLAGGSVPRHELELGLGLEIDELLLTGAVRAEDTGSDRRYVVRNPIYEHYLRQHFHRDRVVHVLCISGEWEQALAYLEAHPPKRADGSHRAALLGVIIDALAAAPDVQEAVQALAGHVSRAFAVDDVVLWLIDHSRAWLEPVSCASPLPVAAIRLTDVHTPEVRGYMSASYELVRDGERRSVYIPLRRRGRRAFGVLALREYPFGPQDDEFLTLLAFTKQISWALGGVIERGRKLMQLKALEETGRRLASALALEDVLRATVTASLTAIGGAQRGVLMLWDETRQRLLVRSQIGFRSTFADEMKLERGQGYVGRVFDSGQPLRIANVMADPRVAFRSNPDIARQKSAAVVPLVAWGRPIGTLCVDNTEAFDVFHEDDEEMLAAFAAQVAVAIQNARVHTELFELGLLINRGDATVREIFRLTVERILSVSGAAAASMRLLRDTHDPDRSIELEPLLLVSQGLGEDFHAPVRPRRDGVTHAALRSRRPVAVNTPETSPGINPVAAERGVRACVCLPMTVQHSILGVLFVYFSSEHNFSQNEIEILSLFANQCALAIATARQREALRVNSLVAWMGIEQSERAHDAANMIATAQNVISGLLQAARDRADIAAKATETGRYMSKALELIRREQVHVPEKTVVDLNELIRQELPSHCDKVGLDLDGLAPGGAPVRAYPLRLCKVLKGLCRNAARAAGCAAAPKVTVRTRVAGGRVEMEMHNPGPPIPVAVKERLLREPITRAQGALGSGFGLLIVRAILLAHGGDVELVRSDENGTVFRMWLSTAVAAEPADAGGRP